MHRPVNRDPQDAVRDAIFEHEIFWPCNFGLVAHAPDFRRSEAAWDFSPTEIDVELDRMRGQGLIMSSLAPGWIASEAGQISRERRWQALGRRHSALSDPSSAIDDLVVAIVKSGGAQSENEARLHLLDHELDVYLCGVAPADRQAALERLISQGLITRDFDLRDLVLLNGSPLRTTPDGDRYYARQVVPRLGICPPATILAPDTEERLPFDELGLDPVAADNLRFRWEEAQRCMGARAWFAATLLFGSILELVLLDCLHRNVSRATAAKCAPRGRIEEWPLAKMIEVAAELGYLDNAIDKFADGLRGTRNFIHPARHIRERGTPDEHVAALARQTVHAVFDALARAAGKNA